MRLVLAGLLLSTLPTIAPAYAAGETCQGEPATIVQAEGGVSGTEGDDVIFASGDQGTQGLSVQAGKGDDLICFGGHLPDGVTSVDAYADIDGGPGTDSLVYIGSDGEDRLWSTDVENVDIHTGEGVDVVRLTGRSSADGVVDAGPEPGHRNTLDVTSYKKDGRVVVDLGVHEASLNGGIVAVTGVDRVVGWGRTVDITGDAGANHLIARACRASLRGGEGDDVVGSRRLYDRCDAFDSTLLGQGGDDRLRGSAKDDVLIGGRGDDAAYGRGGRDRCVAEIEKTCER